MNDDLLKRIGNANGIPGFEDEIQALIRSELADCCDEVTRDHMGNVFGLKKATIPPKKGCRPVRLMFAAHADEIGLMVKHINDRGYIHVIQIGGINAQVCESHRMVIHGKEKVRGVVVPGGGSGDQKAKLDDLLIDTGMPKEEVEKLVSPGDPISFEGDTSVLNGKMWVGRNFDNRIGSYCLTEAMRQMKGKDTAVDVYAVSTVQEEVGLRGASPAAFRVVPDIGVAIDGSMPRQAHTPDYANLCELGQGTGIYMVDKMTIGHPKLVRYLFDLSEKRGIAYQRNIGGGTDAKAMQQSRAGVIATTIGAAVRYMHSTVQLCHADDMDATVDLLVALMETAHEFFAEVMPDEDYLKVDA